MTFETFRDIENYLGGKESRKISLDRNPYHKDRLEKAYSDSHYRKAEYKVQSSVAEKVDKEKAQALADIVQDKAKEYSGREFDEVIYAPLPEGVLGQTALLGTPEGHKYALTINYKLVSKNKEDFEGLNKEAIYETLAHEAAHLVGIEKEIESIRKYNLNEPERFILRFIHEGMNSHYTSVEGSNIEPYAIYQEMVRELDNNDPSSVLNKYFCAAEIYTGNSKYVIFAPSREAIEAELDVLTLLAPDLELNYVDVTKYIRPELIKRAYYDMKEAYEKNVAEKEEALALPA
jgi:hypothetical protein